MKNQELIDRFERLMEAKDNTAIKKLFADIGDVNATDYYGRTPLIYACLNSKVEDGVIGLLLEIGADPNIQDKQQWTPLHAAAQANNLGAAKLLLANGAKINMKNVHGKTPLGVCISRCKDEYGLLKFLLANGANPNLENNYGVSPIKLAEMVGDEKLIEILKQD